MKDLLDMLHVSHILKFIHVHVAYSKPVTVQMSFSCKLKGPKQEANSIYLISYFNIRVCDI